MGVLLVLPSMTATKSGPARRPSSLVAGLVFPTVVCSMMVMGGGWLVVARGRSAGLGWVVELRDEVRSADASQFALDVAPLFGLIPEEELALGEFLALRLGAEDGLEGIGVEACVPGLCGIGHGCRGKVLYLFQMEVELFGDDGEFCHIFLVAARVG